MKNIIVQMSKAFDSRVRLGIMAILLKEEWVDFRSFKEMLGVTDGNLASHMSSLERGGYVEVRKRFVGKRPNTSYRVTPLGRQSFAQYVRALKKLLDLK